MPGDASTLQQMGRALAGLSRHKESIGRATRVAHSASDKAGAAAIIRDITDRMEQARVPCPSNVLLCVSGALLRQHAMQADSARRRVDLLYLVDSILQNCPAQGREAYSRVIAPALPRLVKAAAQDEEGAAKADKVLRLLS